MECPNPACREEVPDHVRNCVVCGADAKVPNVRAAERAEEVRALDARELTAEQDAALRGFTGVLADFRDAVNKSSAVICRSLAKVNELVSSDNQLVATFYQNVRSNAQLPEDNEWDRIRQPVGSLLFPFFFEDLHCAALSLDGSGVSGYGFCCLVLKESSIKDRASVFEENTSVFIKRHRIVPGDKLPLGYRASWTNRAALAVAKLGSRLSPATLPNQYQSILLNSNATDGDFIEVHIYGPIHRRAIQHLSISEPRQKADKLILRSVLRKLKEFGATCTVR